MYKCSVCGKELPYKANKCGDCAKKSLQEYFKENPEIRKAFKESLEETFSPENCKKMAEDACRFMRAIQKARGDVNHGIMGKSTSEEVSES